MSSRKIIVAVNFEEETHAPLSKLRNLDITPQDEVHFVHVVPVILYARGMNLSLSMYPSEEERPEMERGVVKKLEELRREILPSQEKVIYKCLFDTNEKAAFTDYVVKEGADLVVVATRGKHGLTNFFDSSFAQHQLKHSPANVFILR